MTNEAENEALILDLQSFLPVDPPPFSPLEKECAKIFKTLAEEVRTVVPQKMERFAILYEGMGKPIFMTEDFNPNYIFNGLRIFSKTQAKASEESKQQIAIQGIAAHMKSPTGAIYTAIVMPRNSTNKTATLYSFAHELGHVAVGEKFAAAGNRSLAEDQADGFATFICLRLLPKARNALENIRNGNSIMAILGHDGGIHYTSQTMHAVLSLPGAATLPMKEIIRLSAEIAEEKHIPPARLEKISAAFKNVAQKIFKENKSTEEKVALYKEIAQITRAHRDNPDIQHAAAWFFARKKTRQMLKSTKRALPLL